MAEARSKKVSVLIFLFAIFILLAVFTAVWLYNMYKQQTSFSERQTLATVECGRYYFAIDPKSVLYENSTLYFEIENTLGADINAIMVKSATQEKEVALNGLSQGTVMPVSVPLEVAEWVLVYPKGCAGVNFRNITFLPRTT
jgi:flagellar basal body-associated protein FliL